MFLVLCVRTSSGGRLRESIYLGRNRFEVAMDRRKFIRNSALLAGLAGSSHAVEALSIGPTKPAAAPAEHGGVLDLSQAVIAVPRSLTRRERKAVQVLVEEVERRTRIRLPVGNRAGAATIAVGQREGLQRLHSIVPPAIRNPLPIKAEGYALDAWSSPAPGVAITGEDERGVLFGVGGLLRRMTMAENSLTVSANLHVRTSPYYPLRGFQLGYRPKTNSYDGWTVPMWDQYIRDLAVFGANAVELIPPKSDDLPSGPNFWLPPLDMMIQMSRIADDYGLDVWIWYPAMAKDYSDPATVDASLKSWGAVFKALPRIDAIFVPGGDPGHTAPDVLMALLEKQRENLRRYHPNADVWISPQSFDQEWMQQFLNILSQQRPKWLRGVVFGPQIEIDLPDFRRRVPSEYPIRFYPDITHGISCEFPVPKWDIAYAHTEGREVINPRPDDYANIARLYLPYTCGFIAYSEGCNDDVNKCVMNELAWNPAARVAEILRDYCRYFIGDRLADGFAAGIAALERNWRAPLLSNESVGVALAQFQSMESSASPHELLKWRFQQGLYRAYYDAYVRERLIYETALVEQAMARLREVERFGVSPVPIGIGDKHGAPTSALDVEALLDEAEDILGRATTRPVAQDLRARVLSLGAALYQSIRMQLAVELYKAEAVNRAGSLDTLDASITNLPWLLRRVREIRSLPSHEQRLQEILELLHRTDPGPGGFYDDLGDVANEPHLIRGEGERSDPEFRRSALDEFQYPNRSGDAVPLAWQRWAASFYGAPLEMRYQGLDPSTGYILRVVYAGDMNQKLRLAAGGAEIHGYIKKPWPMKPMEFRVPGTAYASGELRLSWFGEPGLGHNGQGCQVAEVWLMRK